MNSTKKTIDNISLICNTFPSLLRSIPKQEFNDKPDGKWSKKEIVGHLIDSAVNNLQRFVRGQIEDQPVIFYEQDKWVAIQQYQNYHDDDLIALWESINRHLIHVISFISPENLSKTCLMKDGQPVTLEFLIADYYMHLLHHVSQIKS